MELNSSITFPEIIPDTMLSLNPTGDCLLDQPEKPLTLPDVLPGASYGLEKQCELSFGAGSKPCPLMQAPCQRLWCTGKTRGQPVCQTRHFPWADGTACGEGLLCMRGVCIETHEVTRPKVSQATTHRHIHTVMHCTLYINIVMHCIPYINPLIHCILHISTNASEKAWGTVNG